MQLLNPYLHFDGRCEEAFNFYAKVLGGEIVAMMPQGYAGRRACPRRVAQQDHPCTINGGRQIAHGF
jgi:uncharacterized glyoxalase superfamily protein PhnB